MADTCEGQLQALYDAFFVTNGGLVSKINTLKNKIDKLVNDDFEIIIPQGDFSDIVDDYGNFLPQITISDGTSLDSFLETKFDSILNKQINTSLFYTVGKILDVLVTDNNDYSSLSIYGTLGTIKDSLGDETTSVHSKLNALTSTVDNLDFDTTVDLSSLDTKLTALVDDSVKFKSLLGVV